MEAVGEVLPVGASCVDLPLQTILWAHSKISEITDACVAAASDCSGFSRLCDDAMQARRLRVDGVGGARHQLGRFAREHLVCLLREAESLLGQGAPCCYMRVTAG